MYRCDGKECQACKLLITNAFLRANDNNSPTDSDSVAELLNDTDESLCMKNRSLPKNAVNFYLLSKLNVIKIIFDKKKARKINVPYQLICLENRLNF